MCIWLQLSSGERLEQKGPIGHRAGGVQVAEACQQGPDCLFFDVRHRAASLTRLAATPFLAPAISGAGFASRLRFLDAAERHLEAVYLVTSLCLIPPGDTASRKALFDAILFGCVPVLFYPESAAFPWHLPADASSFAVLLDGDAALDAGGAAVLDALRSLPQDAIEARRAVCAHLARRLQYGAAEESGSHWAPDALEVTLAGLARSAAVPVRR